MVTGSSNLIDVSVFLEAETDKAYGVSEGELDENGKQILIWLPKSQVEMNEVNEFTMPEWLAYEKGLI